MTISKTSFRFLTLMYDLFRIVFWAFPLKLVRDKKNGYRYVKVSRRAFTFMKIWALLNLVLRIFTSALNTLSPLFVPDMLYSEIITATMRTGYNLVLIPMLGQMAIDSEMQKVICYLNCMFEFNRKLASHFDQPEFVKKDGLESKVRVLKQLAVCGVGMSVPSMAVAISGQVHDMNYQLDVVEGVTGHRMILTVIVFFGGVYMFTMEIVGIVGMIVGLLVGANFMLQWLRIHAQNEVTGAGVEQGAGEERRRQVLYRAHQLWSIFLKDWTSEFIPPLVFGSCCLAIAGFSAVIAFHHQLGHIFSVSFLLIAFTCIAIQNVTIGMANNFMEASQEYIDKGKQRARESQCLVDQKFFRSCQSIQWNIAVVPLDKTLFVTILDGVIFSNVVDLVLMLGTLN